ncbi:MAG TPA: AbrB/MazE/SpoVT family DNA-binding domain-containing protein [Gemmatimonadaceae bacterium]|nr:AbrB/MazE/SpoVT family DNA-binding domain-containing protein [Gemmatimonadaceae bacterium]
MQKSTKLKQLGGSVAVVLPKAILDRFHLAAGDEIHVIETEEGMLLTPFDSDFEDAMAVHDRGERKFRNALRQLER